MRQTLTRRGPLFGQRVHHLFQQIDRQRRLSIAANIDLLGRVLVAIVPQYLLCVTAAKEQAACEHIEKEAAQAEDV